MNNQLIGEFIKIKRKEKGLTQKQLADKLNITDRAISKWERGICCPDISLLKDLSNILEISINELLSGHKIESLKVEDTDNTILNSVKNYTKLENNKTKKRIILITLISIFLILTEIIIYLTYNQINKTDNTSWDTIENRIISNKFLNALEDYDYNTIIKLTLDTKETITDKELELECNSYIEQKKNKELPEPRPVVCLLKELESEGVEFVSHKFMTQYYYGNGNFATQYELKVKLNEETTVFYLTMVVNNGVVTDLGAGYAEDKNYQSFKQKYTFTLHKIHLFFMKEDWMDEVY